MNPSTRITARTASRAIAIAFASLALVATSAQAQGRHFGGGHGGGHFAQGGHFRGGPHGPGFRHGWLGPGLVWGGLGLGIGWGLGAYYGSPRFEVDPGYVITEPPVVYYDSQPLPATTGPVPASAAPSVPDPVIYPRNGQSASKTEADRRECSRWATAQPNATSDASVFQRAIAACMDARGYTLR